MKHQTRILTVFLLLSIALLGGCKEQTIPVGEEEITSRQLQEMELPSAEGVQIRMRSGDTEAVITLNDSRAAAELLAALPLQMTLIERNSFAKGMTLPIRLSSEEERTREYKIGNFGYWPEGPDLANFYDDIYEQTIVEVIPLGEAETDAAAAFSETDGEVIIERIEEE